MVDLIPDAQRPVVHAFACNLLKSAQHARRRVMPATFAGIKHNRTVLSTWTRCSSVCIECPITVSHLVYRSLAVFSFTRDYAYAICSRRIIFGMKYLSPLSIVLRHIINLQFYSENRTRLLDFKQFIRINSNNQSRN